MRKSFEVPTIGHYLIDMEKYFSDAYDALFLKKQRCDIAMATPFPNEDLCGNKICQYYVPQLCMVDQLSQNQLVLIVSAACCFRLGQKD